MNQVTKKSRFISLLSNLSKIYEKYMYDEINGYFDHILSKFYCGFCKGYREEHCLLYLMEKT